MDGFIATVGHTLIVGASKVRDLSTYVPSHLQHLGNNVKRGTVGEGL